MPLTQGWEYRWGDSPFGTDGAPRWAAGSDDPGWQEAPGPLNPPGRGSHDNLWLRIALPDGEWREPVLFISSINLIAEAYLGGKVVYRHGQFDGDGKGRFAGWTWHSIALSEGIPGKLLYLRLFSDYKDIGLWGEVSIMEQADVLPRILKSTRGDLIVSAFCLLLAALAALMVPLQRESLHFGSISLFALSAGTMVLAESDASQLLLARPLLWDYLAALGYFSLPIAMALMLEHWFPTKGTRILRAIWLGHLGYAIAAVGLSLAGVVSLADTFPVFDALLLTSLILLTGILVLHHRTLTTNQRLVVSSYAVFAIFLVVDMLVAHGFVDWYMVPVHLGALAFTLAMVIISLRHYVSSQRELTHLNAFLEREIAERTHELAVLAEQEGQRATQLALENRKTHELGNLIDRLQRTGSIDIALDIIAGELPTLLSPLAGAFYRPAVSNDRLLFEHSWPDGVHFPAILEDVPKPAETELQNGSLVTPSQHIPIMLRQPIVRSAYRQQQDANASAPLWYLPLDVPRPHRESRRLAVLVLQPGESLDERPSQREQTRRFIERGLSRVALVLAGILLQDELATLSYQDGLTGLHNRRYFDELMAHEAAISLRKGNPLSLVMIDIDHFKHFNDRFGHAAGDVVLTGVGRLLAGSFREIDVVCRLGGEEFVVLLPGATADEAKARIVDMTNALARAAFHHEGESLGTISVSCGVASFPHHGNDPRGLLAQADRALYRAKAAGRARIEIGD
ncbi:diguanylate cyclase [Halomonas sp. V046]|uniref:diguanylate cyclase n=1 Tax=Halomonas sp. V046 TaxID=3459611 RepID=UPI00404480E8